MAAPFQDRFGMAASAYARFRPRYPNALFAWLARMSPGLDCAVDVGTGSGQAAVALAAHFRRVVALDPSAAQLAQATAHERVAYRQAPAEALGLADGVADLVLAAQAFHWFDAAAFFAQAAGALRAGGVLALVSYGVCTISAEIDAVVWDLYQGRLGPYWEPERRLVESGYAGITPPSGVFDENLATPVPTLAIEQRLSCDEFIGYLSTWSALSRCRQQTGQDPLLDVTPQLQAAWARGGGAAVRDVVWPLAARAWRRIEPAGDPVA